MCELYTFMRNPNEDLSAGMQGFLINYELSSLLSEVVAATNLQKAGRAYKPSFGMNGGALAFFGSALAGECRLGALICLSQSAQNGWETWYSIAQYGKQLAALKTRVQKVAAAPMSRAVREAEEAAEKAAADLASAGTSASNMKFAAYRKGLKVYTEQRLQYMRMLAGAAEGAE